MFGFASRHGRDERDGGTTPPARDASAPARPESRSPPSHGSIEVTNAAERRLRLIGIALFIAALWCFSGTDTSAKWLSRTLPTPEIVWARYFVAFVFTLCVIKPWANPRVLATKRPGLQAIRSVLLSGSTAFAFLSLRHLQLAEATSISFATPLVVALLAGPVLGEWIGPRRFAAICVGFAGVLVVTRPSSGGAMDAAVLYALAGVLCNCLYYLATRMLASSDSAPTTLAYTSVAGVVLLTPLLPWLWVAPPGLLSWALLLFMGVCGGVSQWLVILAHHRAPAAILAPFIYVQILWTTLLGFVVFGDVPGASTLIGAGIVVGSGLYLWYRERVTKVSGQP